jgi:poly(3-hydroxybutyrate) depolymerase
MHRDYWTFHPCGSHKPRAIIVTIHCLGCTPGHAWDPYLKDAEKNGFILIAPTGYNASFNAAPYCCGNARDIGLDDQGFIKNLVTIVDEGRGLPVFATGVSNGGYMASSLAVAFPGWLTGVAAAAGHIYHGLYSGLHGTAAMILWDENDLQVPPTGCCRDISKPRCCCGISDLGPPQCTNTQELFFAWKRANACKATKSNDNPLGVKGSCQTGVDCQYPVELCTFNKWTHMDWTVLPDVLSAKVFNFFLAQLK